MLALVAPALLVQYGSFRCYNISYPMEAKSKFTGKSEVIESQADAEWHCSETCVSDPVACVPICIGSDCNGAPVESYSYTCGANVEKWEGEETKDCGSWSCFCECAPCIAKARLQSNMSLAMRLGPQWMYCWMPPKLLPDQRCP